MRLQPVAKHYDETRTSLVSFFRAWKTVTESDIWKFLAVCIHLGLVHKPRINDYRATNRIISSTFASTLMVWDCFKMILTFYQLNDNTNYVPAGNQRPDPFSNFALWSTPYWLVSSQSTLKKYALTKRSCWFSSLHKKTNWSRGHRVIRTVRERFWLRF